MFTLGKKKKTFLVNHSTTISAQRLQDGLTKIECQSRNDLNVAMGFLHAHDRLVQMELLRILGEGRICEFLKDVPEALEFDIKMRQLRFFRKAKEDVTHLDKETRKALSLYCEGINFYLENHMAPLEFKLVGYTPRPWSPVEVLLSAKIMTYMGLAEAQQFMEKLFVQCGQKDVNQEKLKKIFHPHLKSVDDELIKILKQVKVLNFSVPQNIPFGINLTGFAASNNWAISPQKSESGNALLCFDPHLMCSRIPPIWYESYAVIGDEKDYLMGISLPGTPYIVMGRKKKLSWGFTYGFMDTIDYFIEDCGKTTYRRGDKKVDFTIHEEKILHKKSLKKPTTLYTFENAAGVLEAPHDKNFLEPGFYLVRSFAEELEGGSSRALNSLQKFMKAETVQEAQESLCHISISANWLLADSEGNIGYQQSGSWPKRKDSGVVPLKAWEEENLWDGLHSGEELYRLYNPEKGFLATANNLVNPESNSSRVNLHMGPTRLKRIESFLEQDKLYSLKSAKDLQKDLISYQAKDILDVIKPYLPETPEGDLLKNWDYQYNIESQAATLFEEVYKGLLQKVFGEGLFGPETWDFLEKESSLLSLYFHYFDNILLNETDPSWYGGKEKSEFLSEIIPSLLEKWNLAKIKPWGEMSQIHFKNIFFDGKLPAFLGVDAGPYPREGGRCCIVQSQHIVHEGMTFFTTQSYRFATDLGKDKVISSLPGGNSGNFLSPYYRKGLRNWRYFQDKTTDLS